MMIVLCVTIWTASAIWLMSVFLKFGVMRAPELVCAQADVSGPTRPALTASAKASGVSSRHRFIKVPRTRRAAPSVAGRRDRRTEGRRSRGRPLRRAAGLALLAGELVGLGGDLRHIQGEILLPSIAHDCDVRLARGCERSKNLLAAGGIVERCVVDGDDEIARA